MDFGYYDFLNDFNLIDDHWYFESRRVAVNKVIKMFINKKEKSKLKILDIGSGIGQFIPVLKNFGKVYAIEPDEKKATYIKNKFDDIILWNESFPNKNSEKQEFDLIICCDVIEHINNVNYFLKEVKKRLKKEGILLITVPAYQWLWSNIDNISKHYRRYDSTSLKEEVENSDFKLFYITYFMSLLLPIAIIVRKIIEPITKSKKKRNKKTKNDSFFYKSFNNLAKIFFSIENIFISKKFGLPFGLSLLALFTKN